MADDGTRDWPWWRRRRWLVRLLAFGSVVALVRGVVEEAEAARWIYFSVVLGMLVVAVGIWAALEAMYRKDRGASGSGVR
ncbi:hypothetical protein [Rhabdothermincola salaria]|uniref:hypothetical protein n=1 Tax=Rhabdothermincola salaria TaxID=2903142 RepID=UPI001E350DDE|nr:hypothetical protein [Rhabdothermincola salaria]MCD9625008.1 hypothetical protein [Rhabdothermincola salaria]